MYDMKNLTKLKKMGELAPEAFKGFMAFDEAVFKEGAIPLKYKELMAVAVAPHHSVSLLHRNPRQAGEESRSERAGTGRDDAHHGRAPSRRRHDARHARAGVTRERRLTNSTPATHNLTRKLTRETLVGVGRAWI